MNQEQHKSDLAEDNDFVEIGVFTPKLSDTEKREVIPEGNNGQNKPSTATNNETVREKLFETPKGGSIRESITNYTNKKSKSTKTLEPKVATKQKQDRLAA